MSNLNNNAAKVLYETGIQSFQQNKLEDGIKHFVKAAKLNYSPAIKELGLCLLHGISITQDIKQAAKYFIKSQDNAESQFELSKLYFFGYGVKKDLKLAKDLLKRSVKNNFDGAIVLMAMCYQISNKKKKAKKLFNLALINQNQFSQHLLQNNFIENLKKKTYKFTDSFEWPQLNNEINKKHLNQNPEIFTVKNLLSSIECEYIKYRASPYMRRSMTIDPQTGKHIIDTIRTSFSATIDWTTEDPAINLIMQKCCNNFAESANQSEVLHVLHYSVGEEYKPHYDFFGGIDGKENFESKTQRIKTICLYLNDVKTGGETTFPRLNLTIKPKKGSAIFFENIDKETNEPYINSLHSGTPVGEGEKWLATLWIRNTSTNRGPNYESI